MSDQLLQLVITQTWQITALAIVVAIVVKLAARNRPHLAHALWILVLIKCVTPPLWGHSLGVFSQLQTFAVAEEPKLEVDDSDSRVEFVTISEVSQPEERFEMPLPHDSEVLLTVNDYNTELQFDAESQSREVTEVEFSQSDIASLRLSDSASEFPLPEAEPKLQAAQQSSSSVFDKLAALLIGGLIIGAIVTLMTMVVRCLRCLRQIRLHQTTEFDEVLRERIKRLTKQLRIHRIPTIIVSDVLFGPAVLGFLRHTIVLPRCLFEDRDSSRSFLPGLTVSTFEFAGDVCNSRRLQHLRRCGFGPWLAALSTLCDVL